MGIDRTGAHHEQRLVMVITISFAPRHLHLEHIEESLWNVYGSGTCDSWNRRLRIAVAVTKRPFSPAMSPAPYEPGVGVEA